MHLYLDDDTAERRLVPQLSHAGYVVVPAGAQLSRASDARHGIYAMQHSLVLVTRNHDDFLDLHKVIRTGHGTHPGILIIRFDNAPRVIRPRAILLPQLPVSNPPGSLSGTRFTCFIIGVN